MSVVAAAVCPHPPIVVPGLAQAAAGELDPLRLAADEAVAGLLDTPADALVVVGAAPRTEWLPGGRGGSFAPWGLDLAVGAPSPGDAPLPLSLTVGRWWLARAGAGSPTGYQGVASDASVGECHRLGECLAALADRVSLLVMGDGSARRGPEAPGTPDERAQRFDDAVAAALAAGDPAALLAISPSLADELLAAGRPAWQVLAAAAGGGGAGGGAGGGGAVIRARLRYAAAPYGVGYFVASWGIR